MTDTNRKEMLAGLFLSKFSAEGLKRLGYKSFKDAYDGLSNLVGEIHCPSVITGMNSILCSQMGVKDIMDAK